MQSLNGVSSKSRKYDEGLSSKYGNSKSSKGHLYRLDSSARFKLGLSKYDLIWYLVNISIAGYFIHWNCGFSRGFVSYVIAIVLVGSAAIVNGVNLNEVITAFPYAGGVFGFSRVTLGHFPAYAIACCEVISAILYLSILSLTLGKIITSLNANGWSVDYEPVVWTIYLGLLSFICVFGGKYVFIIQKVLCGVSVAILLVFCFGSLKYVNFSRNARFDEAHHAHHHPGPGDWFHLGPGGFMCVLPLAFWFFQGIPMVSVTADDSDDPKQSFPFATNSLIIMVVFTCISIIFIWISLPPGLTASNAHQLTPLSEGFELMFGTKSPFLALLSVPAVVTSGFGYVFTYTKLLHSLAQSKILTRWLHRRDSRTGVPYVGVLLGAITSLVCCFIVFYVEKIWKNDLKTAEFSSVSLLFNIAIFCTLVVYAGQAVCFISLQLKFRNIPRLYHSPFGIPSAVYACIIWVLCLVSLIGFQRDGQVSLIVFAAFFLVITGYYHLIAKDKQIISKSETKVLFTAHVINYNIKKARRSRYSNREESVRTPRLLRLMTPTTLKQFAADSGLNLDMPNFMRARSNASPTRSRSSMRLDGLKTFPSSNDMTSDIFSSKNSSKTSRFMSLFSARRSDSSGSLNTSSRRGFFWSRSSKDKDMHDASSFHLGRAEQSIGNAREAAALGRQHDLESARDAEHPVSVIPEESSRSIGSVTAMGNNPAPTAVSAANSVSRSRSSNTSAYNMPTVHQQAGPDNLVNSSSMSVGMGAAFHKESPKNSNSSPNSGDNNFSRHSSNASQKKSSTSSVYNASVGKVSADTDYGMLLQGLALEDMLNLDPVYHGPFSYALRRTITEAAMGGDYRDFSNELPDSDEEGEADYEGPPVSSVSEELSANVNNPKSNKLFKGKKIDVTQGFEEFAVVDDSPKESVHSLNSKSGSFRANSSKSSNVESPVGGNDDSFFMRMSSKFGRLLSGGAIPKGNNQRGFAVRASDSGKSNNRYSSNGSSKALELLDEIEEECGSPSPAASTHIPRLSPGAPASAAAPTVTDGQIGRSSSNSSYRSNNSIIPAEPEVVISSSSPLIDGAETAYVGSPGATRLPPVSEVSKRGGFSVSNSLREREKDKKSSPNGSPNHSPNASPDKAMLKAGSKPLQPQYVLSDEKDDVGDGSYQHRVGSVLVPSLSLKSPDDVSKYETPRLIELAKLSSRGLSSDHGNSSSRSSHSDQLGSLRSLAIDRLTKASTENMIILDRLDSVTSEVSESRPSPERRQRSSTAGSDMLLLDSHDDGDCNV